MIILEAILTTFKSSVILEADGAVVQIFSSLISKHHKHHAQIHETLCSFLGAIQIIRDTFLAYFSPRPRTFNSFQGYVVG